MKKIGIIAGLVIVIAVIIGVFAINKEEVEVGTNELIENTETNNQQENNESGESEILEAAAFSIETVSSTQEIKNEAGTTLINVKLEYPAIKNEASSKFIEEINNEYKTYAANVIKDSEESKEDAQYVLEGMGDQFMPYTRELTYEVNMNENGLLSITTILYVNNNGAHGNFIKETRNFDMNQEKELELSDIINNEAWEIKTKIYTLFKEKLEKDEYEFDEIAETTLKAEIENVQYYLKEDAVVLYFNQDQIAPHALGEPTVEIPYDAEIFLREI